MPNISGRIRRRRNAAVCLRFLAVINKTLISKPKTSWTEWLAAMGIIGMSARHMQRGEGVNHRNKLTRGCVGVWCVVYPGVLWCGLKIYMLSYGLFLPLVFWCCWGSTQPPMEAVVPYLKLMHLCKYDQQSCLRESTGISSIKVLVTLEDPACWGCDVPNCHWVSSRLLSNI